MNSRVEQVINNLRATVVLLANDILHSNISLYIRITELITMLIKTVEGYRSLSGREKKQVVIKLGLSLIAQYAPEADRDTLESLFNEDASDIIELIISTTHIVNIGFIRRLLTCCS